MHASQVTNLSERGARSWRRARATALLLCRSSRRGTTGKVPVGGPVVTSWAFGPVPVGDVERPPTFGTLPVWVKARRWSGPVVTAATTLATGAPACSDA